MTAKEADIWRPDDRFDDPKELGRALERRVLPVVGRPARYLGGEAGAIDSDQWCDPGCNLLLCFPDAYEVGMSHTGLRILYTLLNDRPDTVCDLAFTPWPDMEAAMRENGLPLFGLQTRRAARSFDVVGFSLGYELAYTNMLTMIALSGVPLRAADRAEGDPLIIAGGTCTMNPTVVGPFCDVVLPGDGEESITDVAAVVAAGRRKGASRDEILGRVRAIPGAWWPGAVEPVQPRVLADLNAVPMPRELVPITEPVHDRLALEVMRGCARGCRFCQAGMIQRPVRERDVAAIVDAARHGARETGRDEIGLLSLSTSDYSGLSRVVAGIQDDLKGSRTNLVLPSLRVDSIDSELYERIHRERPGSVTFAPEAGTQRLRDVVNKRITEDEILSATDQAFRSRIKRVKLYFMIGLPTETNEDLDGIIALAGRVVALAPRGGSQVTVSISPFSPKAHTPFQWSGQIPREEIARRNNYLARRLGRLKVKVSLREPEISFLETVLGLGDARAADTVEAAWSEGARFDAWDELWNWDAWQRAFTETGLDAAAITAPRDPEAPLPWDVVRGPIAREFLRREWDLALAGETTPDCRLEGPCTACAACDGGLSHVEADLRPAAPEPQPQSTVPISAPTRAGDDEDPRWRFWRERASAKTWCRVEFAKQDRMVFLGHLDFQRQLHLALRRSGLPVAYSKGYHPHPLVKFGPPLAVGVAGTAEVMDLAFQWIEPDWERRLDAALPLGLRLVRGVIVGSITPPSIDTRAERLDFRVVLPTVADGGPEFGAARAAVTTFLEAEQWPWRRCRPGKPDVEVDARRLVPFGSLTWVDDDSTPTLHFSLVRGDKSAGLPVHEFLAALFGDVLPEPRWCAVTRTGIYGRDDNGDWLSPFEEILVQHRLVWLRAHLND